MARSILMLGGSHQQVVAIEAAKRLGYRTVLCDYLPDNPGQFVADVFYQESTTDKDAMLKIATEEKVEGVLAYASDPASPIAAYVAEQLGLPTNPLWAVETMSQKHLFRAHLQEQGLPCPRAVAFSTQDDPAQIWKQLQELTQPIMVKPTDSSGSKGVSIVKTEGEFIRAVEIACGISRNGTLIAEEYIEKEYPHVVGGDIFVVEGKIRFWGLMDCVRDASADLIPTGKMAPAGLSEEQVSAIKETLQALVDSLEISFGELNVEVILGKGNTPYVLELGSRAGGNMIPVQLSDMSGIDLVSTNVLCAMGEKPERIDFDRMQGAYATHVLHSLESGAFTGIDIDENLLPQVYRTVLYAREGDRIEPFDGANKAVGIVFMKYDSPRQMRGIMPGIKKHIHVRLDGMELKENR